MTFTTGNQLLGLASICQVVNFTTWLRPKENNNNPAEVCDNLAHTKMMNSDPNRFTWDGLQKFHK